MGKVFTHMTMSLDGFIADPNDQVGELFERWPRTTFVDGVEVAITEARRIAGDQDVNIASTKITQQALDLGLVDEVCVSLVPVLFGEGVPYFTKLDRGHQLLDDPIVLQGRRALHLRYPVRR